MQRLIDLKQFKNVLPYASEIFGVYQPLLGWKSKRIKGRFTKGFERDRRSLLTSLTRNFKGNFQLDIAGERLVLNRISTATYVNPNIIYRNALINTLTKALPEGQAIDDGALENLITEDSLNRILNEKVTRDYMENFPEMLRDTSPGIAARTAGTDIRQLVSSAIEQESKVAGMLLYLKNNKQYDHIKALLTVSAADNFDTLLNNLNYKDPFDFFDPKKQLDQVGLSPVGIVHLFRQYFFELDTFLGSPVSHVWLSPGASVELIEVSTRRTTVERTTESSIESTVKTEKDLTEQDEISDAVKEDNQTNTKFGASVDAHQSWIWGSANESANFGIESTQKTAREQTHKHMRQQTEKLSTEIKKNFKTTFKTVTETTDTSSKRYVLSNTTLGLVNYELRRKMRQVGVQVQDIGTYLCWQTFADDPGKQLGVAELVNIAQPADLDNLKHPDSPVFLKPQKADMVINFPYESKSDHQDTGTTYYDGDDQESWPDHHDFITWKKGFKVEPPDYGYSLDQYIEVSPQHSSVCAAEVHNVKDTGEFEIWLRQVNFNDQANIPMKVTLTWNPSASANASIKADYDSKMKEFDEAKMRAEKEAYVKAVKERVKLASNIQPRKFEDLREEERIVVYRILIQELLTKGIKMPDDATRHIVSELINSIFDVEKMLYFVAPEWWRPRLHQSSQTLGAANQHLTQDDVVSWGGINEKREDNYYITEDSVPAKLGSSLGWLLQLDGDNLRNAFLNAPWVKAVIPIRPGKEKAAMNWLKQVEGMNGIGPSDMYTGKEPNLAGKTMIEVLEILAAKVAEKHEQSTKVSDIPDPDDPTGNDNKVSATPVDKVYEHGFYPLQGGFRANIGDDFEVFDQWVEVLPTDQVVAVEVKYDPKTGRQIDIT